MLVGLGRGVLGGMDDSVKSFFNRANQLNHILVGTNISVAAVCHSGNQLASDLPFPHSYLFSISHFFLFFSLTIFSLLG